MTIKKILGNEEFDVMVEKINENFTNIAQLNGGPRGKYGKQGIPGLPGLQGRTGFKGDNGFDGVRVFLVQAEVNPGSFGLPNLPPEVELPDLIANHVYSVGDVFIWQDPTSFIHKVSKIIDDNGNYVYQTYYLQSTTTEGDLWIAHTGNESASYIRRSCYLNRRDPYNDPRDYGYFQNAFIDYRKTFNYATAESTLVSGSAINSIGIFSKRHFKLGLTQTTPPKCDGSIFFAYSSTPSCRFNNMWNVYPTLSQTYNNVNILNNDEEFNDPATGDGGDTDLSVFDLIRCSSPIAYLQGVKSKKDGTQELSTNFTDFGISIQKIQSDRFGAGPKKYKTILTIASDNAGENDVYIKQKRLWTDGSYFSEINLHTQNNGERFYSPIVTPHIVPGTRTNEITTPQKINFGISTYYNSQTGGGDPTTDIKFMTGFQINHKPSLHMQQGSINTFLSNCQAMEGLPTDADTRRTQVMRIDENGRFLFQSANTSASIENEYQDYNILDQYYADYVFRSEKTGYRGGMLRIENVDGKHGFVVTANPQDSYNLSQDIGATLYLNNPMSTDVCASYTVYVQRPVKSYRSWELDSYPQHTDVKNVGEYTHTAFRYGLNGKTGFVWGLSRYSPIPFSISYTPSHNMGYRERETGGIAADSMLWFAKKWDDVSTVTSFKPYTDPLTPTTVETGILLHKGRLQMSIGDNPTDILGTDSGETNLTGSVMTSKNEYGLAQWSRRQNIVGDYQYIDLIELHNTSVPSLPIFTSITENVNNHIIHYPNEILNSVEIPASWMTARDYVFRLPAISQSNLDLNGDEHNITIKADISNPYSSIDYSDFNFKFIYDETDGSSDIVIYELNDMEKDMFLHGSIINIKIKCIHKNVWTYNGSFNTFTPAKKKVWSVIDKSNAFLSSDTTNTTVWGEDVTYTNYSSK